MGSSRYGGSGRRGEKRQAERAEERKVRDAAREVRHGMERQATAVLRCADCGHQTAGEVEVGPQTTCAGCSASLHNCRNCRHFDTGSRFECRAEIAARVESKIAANDCALYAPKTVLDATGKRATGPTDARSAFDALFKK